jgi:hypothetical protein
VAIVQISQITNRKGLAENLPQLAGAELGWSTDTRQLWIGNGTLADGAPVVGNTEILTEFSDILNIATTYTYKGQAAGYTVQTGPTSGTPVVQSLQSWLDQFASVKDFGAVGDGTTDDTDAINRALYQLYCIEINPQIRRSLFFPAGVYRVTGSINIPPYATLYGEGNDNSVIAMDLGVSDYVARTADSLQQIGPNIGTGGAIAPTNITISNMGFTHNDPTGDVFLVEDVSNMLFQSVGIRGTSTTADLTSNTNNSAGVTFSSTPSLICQQVTFNSCVFSNLVWGVYSITYNSAPGNLNSQVVQGLTISESNFNTLYTGIILDNTATNPTGPGTTGARIIGNRFDLVYAQGITFGNVTLNASGQNIFYNVGNGFTSTPSSTIIEIQNNNNISISDLFARSDANAAAYPRINLNHTVSIASTNGSQLAQGSYTRQSGQTSTIINDQPTTSIFTFDASGIKAFKIDYTVIRDVTYRTGTIMVATNGATANLNSLDTGVENASTGVTLTVSQTGSTVSVNYSSDNRGDTGTIYYSVTYLA